MWYLNLAPSGLRFVREATQSELEWYNKTAIELREYEDNIARFDRVDCNYNNLELTLASCNKKMVSACKIDIQNAVANFLYSFNECLDHWKVYISRKYGELSDYYQKYEKLTHEAFDRYDEYKITYALRNYQHIDNAVHGSNIRYDKPAFIYAMRDVLLREKTTFRSDTREALKRQKEIIDLFSLFTVAKKALELINLRLLFYPLTPEIKQHAIQALNLHRELCPEGGGLIIGQFTAANGSVIPPEKLHDFLLRNEPMGLDYDEEISFSLCALIEMWKDTDFKNC